jgi:hypothetical protein
VIQNGHGNGEKIDFKDGDKSAKFEGLSNII